MKMKVFVFTTYLLVCIVSRFGSASTTKCDLRATQYGHVCVCNVTYCDYMDVVEPDNDNDCVVTSSSKKGLRFANNIGKFSEGRMKVKELQEKEVWNSLSAGTIDATVKVDRDQQFQKILGFGAGYSTSVAYNVKNMAKELQDALYLSYYSKKGLNLEFMRMSIGGSDFDLEPWSYNELPENDTALTNFTHLDPRDLLKIAQLKRLKFVTGLDDLKIIGCAWSPPIWMKTNNKWDGYGFLKKNYYQTWADYHLRYLELMDANDMPVWAITTGNQPTGVLIFSSNVKFLSIGWFAEDQAIWVADNLGPTIKNSRFNDVLILCNDDQRFSFPSWFDVMKATRKESLNYVDGLSVHWYYDNVDPGVLDLTHNLYSDKLIFNTESSIIHKNFKGLQLGSWENGEQYANSILEDLRHWFNCYMDWNIVLNEKGGPHYEGYYVEASTIANTTSGSEFYKQPIYYVLGHFSKFITKGSMRIKAESSNSNIGTVAFIRPGGDIVCVLFNRANSSADVTLEDSLRGNMLISIPARSLHTVQYK